MRLVALVLAGLLLVACGQEPALTPPDAPEGEEQMSEPVDAEGSETLAGTLGGDAQLEGGCAWLDTDEGRFEVLYPDGYTIAFEPVRLLDAGGDTVAEAGDALRVTGAVATDRMSFCQVGTIFQATEVRTGT